MAIFSSSRKDKHKKSGSAGGAETSSPPLQQGAFASHGRASTGQALSGSIGRNEGSGIPVPSSSALYASTSSQGGPVMGAPLGVGQQLYSSQGAGGGPQSILQQQQHPNAPTPPPPSHTVLYPWSQRPLALLPSQLLPPASAVLPGSPSSPSLTLEPLLGAPSPLPFPRYGHSVNPLAAAASTTGDLYIFGGLVQNTVKNDLYVMHCAGPGGAVAALANGSAGGAGGAAALQVALLETRGEVPGPRVGHASVSVGNVLIVWGGDTKTRPEERQDDGLYLLNLSTREWTRVKTLGRAPEGRYGHAAAMVGSRFYVFGGQTDDGGFRNDLGWFDLQKLKQGQPRWSFVDYSPSQVVPPPRTGHTCVTHGDCLYIFGGTDGSYHYNDTWCYDLTTSQWTELACIGYIPVPREGHAATLVDDVMYVFGGRGVDGKDLEDLAAFKISNHRWFMFQNMGPAPSGRSGHAMATWQTKVLVLGGESYTSQRADDPSVVHVLDTTKIKYPPDSARPAQQPAPQPSAALSQLPHPSLGPGGQPNSQQQQQQQQEFREVHSSQQQQQQQRDQQPLSSSSGSQRKSSIPVSPDLALRDRAASPTGSQRGLKSSLTGSQTGGIAQTMLNGGGAGGEGAGSPNGGTAGRSGIPLPAPSSPIGAGGASKIAKRVGGGSGGGAVGGGGAPSRPARPDDAEAFTAGAVPLGGERARSPPTVGAGGVKLRNQPSVGSLNGGGGGSPQIGGLSGFAQQQQQQYGSGGEGQQQQQAPSDAFYYSNGASSSSPRQAPSAAPVDPSLLASHASALSSRDARITALEQREKWIVAALQSAREKGFVMPAEGEARGVVEESEGDEPVRDGETEGRERKVLEAVVGLKGELAKAKTLMAEQASALNERFQGADRSRIAALQEAAYYRAKLSAFEAASPSDVAKLERERSAELEQKLSDALSSRTELEAQLAKLEEEASHHSSLRFAAEEQHQAVLARADATDQSHARALADFADLQKRSHSHERTIAEHVASLASLTSSHAQLEADNQRYKGQVDEHETSLAGYLRTLEGSQEALTAAQTRNDELLTAYEKATTELTTQQTRVAELEQQVQQLQVERDAATAKAEELQGLLSSTREAHDKAHSLATGGLAELLAAHKQRQTLRDTARSAGTGDDDNDDDLPLPEHHVARLRAIETEASTHKQLHSEAQAKSDELATELEAVRAREIGLHQELSTLRKQLETVQSQHALAAEQVKEHKTLAASHASTARTISREKDAAEVKASLLRSLLVEHGLAASAPSEADLNDRFAPVADDEDPDVLARRVQELTAAHDVALRSKAELEQRVRAQESEVVRLKEEVSRVQQGGEEEERQRGEREKQTREELEGLQGRHQQLEQTHLKAVQYVKGTEKMLRRMKEELTRYKERCEELEHPDRQAELDTLRQQVDHHSSRSESATREASTLQQRLEQLQGEYQLTLRQQQEEAKGKVEELTSEVGKLDQELEKAHAELEETLAVNASLNKELQAALKNPSSPRSGSVEDHSRLQTELESAVNKTEWLKRENQSLEQRCRTAEDKIAILLDHMESVQSDPYDGSVSHGSQQGSPHFQQQHQQHDVASDPGSDYEEEPHRR